MDNLKRIKDLITDNDMTISSLAREIDVSKRSLQYYLKGQYELPIDILIKIADYYNVSLDYLTYRTDKKKINK